MKLHLFAIALIASAGAQALDTLSSNDLLALCNSQNDSEVVACTSYINGFLDGAYATDPRVADNIVSEMQKDESFSERAIRTRLGNSIARFGPSYYAGFCVPGELTMGEMLADVKQTAQEVSPDSARQNARDYLYQLLQQHYPCERQD